MSDWVGKRDGVNMQRISVFMQNSPESKKAEKRQSPPPWWDLKITMEEIRADIVAALASMPTIGEILVDPNTVRERLYSGTELLKDDGETSRSRRSDSLSRRNARRARP